MTEQKALKRLQRQLRSDGVGPPERGVERLLEPTPALAKYRELCEQAGRRVDGEFALKLQHRVFDLDVTRLEHEGPEDVLGNFLKVLTSTGLWNYVRIVDRKPGKLPVNSRTGPLASRHKQALARNKDAIGKRVAKAFGKLKRSRTLERVDLEGLRTPTWTEVAKAMRRCAGLKELHIHNCRMGDGGLKVLAAGLRRSPLNKLRLSSCGLTGRSGGDLAALLKCHAARRVDLRWKDNLRIKAEGDAAPAKARDGLAGTGLTALDLSRNEFGDRGARALCEALEDDEWFLQLDLRANAIGRSGMDAVLGLLQRNPGVAVIDLAENLQIPAEIAIEASQLMNQRFAALPERLQRLTLRWDPAPVEPPPAASRRSLSPAPLPRKRRTRGKGRRSRGPAYRPGTAPPAPRRPRTLTTPSPKAMPAVEVAQSWTEETDELSALQSRRGELDNIVAALGQLSPGDNSSGTVVQLVDYLSRAFEKLETYLDKLETPQGAQQIDAVEF